MAIRRVLTWPDQRLRQRSAALTLDDPSIPALYRDLCDTMADEDGIGIAAPQIGVFQQMFVIDPCILLGPEVALGTSPICFINPVVVPVGRIRTQVEGCLSFPGEEIRVPRSTRVNVTAFGLDGQPFVLKDVAGLYARCIQHEYDHLVGRLLEDFKLGAWAP